MVVDTKLYDLLGVSPDVSQAELRRAYKKKAVQLHPDKNQNDPEATEKFQAVNEAYEVLKDEDKRRAYDQMGMDALKGGADGAGMGDFFSSFFGRGFGGFGGGGFREKRRQRTPDMGHTLNVSLEDLYNGKEVTLRIGRNALCPECNGKGAAPGKAAKKCSDCGGRGQKVQVIRMGPMMTQQVTTCPTCRGSGEMIDARDKCKKCSGQKVVDDKKIIVVHIEPGMESGEKIVFQGCADEAPDADAGDFVVHLQEKPHAKFARKHNDLLMVKKLTLSEALLGAKFVVHHLDGRELVVTTNPGEVIVPGAVKVIEREGMPVRRNVYEKGRLFIKFEITFPKGSQITPALQAALRTAMPPPQLDVDLNDDNVYQVTMRDSDIKQFENAKSSNDRRREAYNSYDDDDEDAGQTASCQPM